MEFVYEQWILNFNVAFSIFGVSILSMDFICAIGFNFNFKVNFDILACGFPVYGGFCGFRYLAGPFLIWHKFCR